MLGTLHAFTFSSDEPSQAKEIIYSGSWICVYFCTIVVLNFFVQVWYKCMGWDTASRRIIVNAAKKILLQRNYCTLYFFSFQVLKCLLQNMLPTWNGLMFPRSFLEKFSSGWSRFCSLQTYLHRFENPLLSARNAGLFSSPRFFSSLETRQYTVQLPLAQV